MQVVDYMLHEQCTERQEQDGAEARDAGAVGRNSIP